jgi:cytochrome c peroxidase
MHDGSIATLNDVLDHYARGGQLTETGEHSGDGRLSPFKSEFVSGFELSDKEKADLIEFLSSLTDQSVLSDDRWSNPSEQ